MKQLYIAIVLICLSTIAQSQDNAFMFLKGVPQTTQINPAFRPVKEAYLALPAIGGVKVNGANTGFSWSDIIRSGTGLQSDSLVVDLDNMAAALQDNNIVAAEASLQILGFGFNVKNAFVSVDVNHRMKAKMNYPKSLLDLRYGNWDYENDVPINHSMADMYVNSIDYTEIALGVSYPITDNIVVGGRVKYLMGVANVQSERFNLGIETFENGNMQVNSDVAFRTSFPMEVEFDEDGYVSSIGSKDDVDVSDYFFSGNTGFGFDLGITWKVIDKLTIGAAVNDIGYINWKSNTNQFYSDGVFDYDGIDVSDELTGDEGDKDYWDQLAEDFEDTFKVNANEGAYKTGLMGSFNVTADYQLKRWLNVGAVSKSYIVDDVWIPETTLAVGMHPGKALSTVFTYSMMKNTPANFGAALALTAGGLQIYMATDNLNSLLKPSKAHYVNARLGINFVI